MADKALEVASQISNKQITGIISYWYNGQWINIADTNQRNHMQKAVDALSGLDQTVATLPHSYYSSDKPTGTSYNDTDRWYKTSTDSDGTIKYTPYKWDSTTSSWQPMLDQSAIHAFTDSAPTSPVEGDFWTDDGTLKQYQGGQWIEIPTEGPQGLSSYSYFAYANSADGSDGFSVTPFEKAKYIGTLTSNSATQSTNYADYEWTQLLGDPGTKGTDGVGIKTTTVTYKESTSGTSIPTGNWTTVVPPANPGNYLWTRTVFTYSNGNTDTAYSVARMGTNGTNGVGIKTTTVTYQASGSGTSVPSGSWTSEIPQVTDELPYLWTRTILTYTNDVRATSYSVARKGNDGKDGATKYTWIKYATDDSGANISDSPVGMSYIGIAYNKDTSDESSTPTDYTWSLIKGDKGVPGANGSTTYFHVAYANSADGATDFTLPAEATKSYEYLGTYTDSNPTSSTDHSKYTWVAMFDSTKKRNFISQPTTPYAVGDTWTQSGATYFCTTARATGAFTASDWTMQQLTIHFLDSDVQAGLNDNVKTTGNYKGVTLNDAGLTATAGATKVAMNSTDGFLVSNSSGQVFHVDTKGNLTMQGDITAGNISGVNLAGNNLTLAGILAVTGAITNQFSYIDENQITNVGSTIIANGGMKSVANRTLPSGSDNEASFLHVISYEFSPRGYRSFGYKNQADYAQDKPQTITLYDDDGPYLTSGTELESAYHLGGFSGNSLNDNGTISDKVLIQFGDMLKYASSEAQHSGSASYKDWFDVIAGIQSHPNLLLNSTFINGQTSWDGFNDQCYMANVTHDGNFAVCIESAGGGNFISQNLSHIPDPGHKICPSFWADINKTDGGFNGGVLITFQGVNVNYVATIGDSNPTYEPGWHYYAFNPITVPNGTTGIRFSFYNNEHTGNKVYYAQPMLNDGDHTWPYMPTY